MFENASSIREFLSLASEHYGVRPAFSYLKNGETYSVSYSDFAKQVTAAAKTLISKGIKNQKISVASENSYFCILWAYAIPVSGNVLVMLDNLTNIQEKAYIIEHSEASCLIYSSMNQPLADYLKENNKNVTNMICMETDTEGCIGSESEEIALPETDGTEVSYIFYTSGTTGRPKGVMHSQINLLRNELYFSNSLNVKDTVYLMLPVSHILTFANVVLTSMYMGTNVFISAGIRYLWTEMEAAKPYFIFSVPAILAHFDKSIQATAQEIMKTEAVTDFAMAREMANNRLFGGNLRQIIIGGAPLNLEIAKRMQELNILVLNGYGLTETCGSITVNPHDDNRMESVGRINFNSEGKVIDGELAFRNPYIFKGYYKDPEATKQAFDGEWFLTGDIGYIEDNYVYITGRKKNVIILPNGKNISPEELEAELLKIEEIKEVVVCEQDGKLTAKVYSDQEDAVVRQKINEANKNLSSYKQIENIIFYTEEFPKTSSKKIKRGEI